MSDLIILSVLLLVGLLPALALSGKAALGCMVLAATGVLAFLFLIPSGPDSPLNFWIAAVLVGSFVGAAAKMLVGIRSSKIKQVLHG